MKKSHSLLITTALTLSLFSTVQPVFALDVDTTETSPHDALKFMDAGDKLFHADDLTGSIAQYRKAVHAAPLNSAAHERLAHALSLNNSLSEADEVVRQSIKLDGKNSLAHARYGWILGRQGKYKTALAEENIAVDLDPNNAFAYQTMGLIETSTGDYAQAIQAYENAIRIDPDDLGSYLNMAAAMGRKGDYAGAVSVYRKGISLGKRSSLLHIGLGSALGKMGDLDGQLREFQTAVTIAPKSANAHGKLSYAFSQKKDTRGAVREAIIASMLRLETSWSHFMQAMITTWAAVFLLFGALFTFLFVGSRFKPQAGEEVLSSFFLVFYKERPGRFVVTSRRLVYVPESVSLWFGATRLSIERDQVESFESVSTVSGGTVSIVTKDSATHKFAMPNLVLEPLTKRLESLNVGNQTDLVSA